MAIMKKMKKRYNRNKRRAMVGAVKSAYKGGSGKATVGTALAAKGTLKRGSKLDKVVRKTGKTVRKAKAAKAKFKKSFAAGKKDGNKKTIRGITTLSRKTSGNFQSNFTGRKRKGNLAGKAGAVAGIIGGKASFKMTGARKAALKKAQQASARLRKGKKRLFGK
jgi:hypothetical protein